MTAGRAALQQDVPGRRALGFTLRRPETWLTRLGAYRDHVAVTTVTMERAVPWGSLGPPTRTPGRAASVSSAALRAIFTRGVPGTDVLAVHSQRPGPFVDTMEEMRALMTAADHRRPTFERRPTGP